MFPYNDTIIVKEYIKDISKDGILIKGGDSANYFLAQIEYINSTMEEKLRKALPSNIFTNELKEDYILVIGQLAKLPFINNRYIVSEKDIRGIMYKPDLENNILFPDEEK